MGLQGCIDRINLYQVSGWVFDTENPDIKQVVELYVGNEFKIKKRINMYSDGIHLTVAPVGRDC